MFSGRVCGEQGLGRSWGGFCQEGAPTRQSPGGGRFVDVRYPINCGAFFTSSDLPNCRRMAAEISCILTGFEM